MPLVVKEYTWTESSDAVYITIPLKGVNTSKADVYANDEYIKVNFPPYFFELNLYAAVESESAVAAVGNGCVKFTLTKKEHVLWNRVTTTISDHDELKRRRAEAEQKAHQRQEELRQERLRRKRDEERQLVQKQIEVERAERERVAALKEEEKRQAQAALAEWAEDIKTAPPVEEEEQNDIAAAADFPEQEEGAIFADDDLADEAMDNSYVPSGITEIGDEDEVDDEDVDDEAGIDMEAIRAKVREQMQGKARPPPRATNAEIEITFTSRGLIPTKTARESEDAKWRVKIADAQAAYDRKQKKSDARNIEEQNPVFLKDKGNDFYRKGNFAAAVNAYTAALDLDPENISCLSNRAACHLQLSQPNLCITDCTRVLTLLQKEEDLAIAQLADTPEAVERRRKAGLKVLLRRGAAKVAAGDMDGGRGDYEQALALDPKNDDVKTDLIKLEGAAR
ncbi:Dynein assembly factor 4, axonemal [Rhizophlyctis rosea]|nr:Dynein assembly factor 4, axonemal [Rhizophlyctis rosea]